MKALFEIVGFTACVAMIIMGIVLFLINAQAKSGVGSVELCVPALLVIVCLCAVKYITDKW